MPLGFDSLPESSCNWYRVSRRTLPRLHQVLDNENQSHRQELEALEADLMFVCYESCRIRGLSLLTPGPGFFS